MPTEDISARFADLDLWPTGEVVQAMLEGHMSAAAAVQSQAAQIASAANEAASRLGDPAGRLIYVGAGTSGRIAVLDGVELGPTFGWSSARVLYLIAGGQEALASSVEGAEDDAAAGEAEMRGASPSSSDVVIAVAASGRTPYTVAAVRAARSLGALTIGLAGNPDTALLQAADHPILLDTGAEIVAGSTRMKAGTAQKIALNLLSTAVMIRLGRVCMGQMVDMRVSNEKLRHRAVEMICNIAGVSRPEAEAALTQSGDAIKLAVLMALGNSADQGNAILTAAGGNLRAALAKSAHG